MIGTLRNGMERFYNGFDAIKTIVLAVVFMLYLGMVAFGGGSPISFVWFGLVMLLYLVLPGFLLMEVTRAGRRMPQIAGMLVLLLGSGFFAVLYCFSMRLGIIWLLCLMPPLMSAALLVWKLAYALKSGLKVTVKKVFVKPKPHVWLLLLLYAALLFLSIFSGVIKNARPSAVGEVLLNQDLLWNVGNANSFKLGFPPQDIRFYDVRLHYHYLTELLAGGFSIVSGLDAYDILAFYLQPFMLAALVFCLYQFGQQVYQNDRFKAVLFPFSLFLFSCASLWKILPNGWSVFWNSNITHMITNINSQTTAVVFLCIFCGLFVYASTNRFRVHPIDTLLLLAALVMLSFSKGPLAAIVVCGMAAALFIGVFTRKTGWRGILLGIMMVAVFGLIYLTMFKSGADDSMMLSSFGTLEKGYFYNILQHFKRLDYRIFKAMVPVLWVVQTVLMIPAQFPLYLWGIGRDLRNFRNLSVERLFFNAVAVGGLLAFFLFNHPAMSQTYFLFGAIFFVNLLVVGNLGLVKELRENQRSGIKKTVKKLVYYGMVFLAAVGLLTTCFLYINLTGSGLRQLGRNAGLIPKYPYDTVVTPDDEAAMLWLRDNSPKEVMFATNRIHTGTRKEGVSNLYSAFCERQGYMEGFQYAKTNKGVSEQIIQSRLQVNNALFSPETPPGEILELCRQEGIEYLVFSAQMDGSDQQMGEMEKVYDSPSVRIYRLPDKSFVPTG